MSFQSPSALFLFLLIPLYFLLLKLNILQKPFMRCVISDWNGKPFEWNNISQKILNVIAKILFYFGFAFAVIALSEPVIRHQEKIYTSRGTDILFIIDTSPSMVARDINGKTRLQAAKDAALELFTKNPGARYGLVAMGSEAAIVVPPTNDFDIFSTRLHNLSEGSMGDGTAIGVGLSTAIYHLISSAAPKKCIVLFTDGENNAGAINPETAAEMAKYNDINLYIFGVGTKGAVPINYTDPQTGKIYSGYLNSDFDSSALKNLSDIAGGKYFEATTINDLGAALNIISSAEITLQDFTYKTVNDSYFQKMIYISLVLVSVGWIIKRIFLRYGKFIFIRTLFFALAFLMLILSSLGLSWGTYLVPVQKNSNAVALVFDVSNSMLADDEENSMTRLKAASVYAKKLLSKMSDTSVSVILAKGDGVTAIPLTEDFAMIESLLDVLSPNLMTAPGTSLGKGVVAAKNSFPKNISAVEQIWLFTDGEETDSYLQQALVDCMKNGLQVSIIGFGSLEGKIVLAGDGKTTVRSFLNSDGIQKTISEVVRKVPVSQGVVYPYPQYFRAGEKSSAYRLLSPLEKNRATGEFVSYEFKTINHYKLFLMFGFIFLVLAILCSELNLQNINLWKKSIFTSSIFFITLFNFSSCNNSKINGEAQSNILKGTGFYRQGEYEKSVAEFFSTYEMAEKYENEEIKNYVLYDLACSYIMMNESDAALERLSKISSDAPATILYHAYFNAGVIYFQNGNKDLAAEFFRKALEIDGTKIEAKINLELSQNTVNTNANETEAKLTPASDFEEEASSLEKGIFELIKENDKGQWKNSEPSTETDLSSDY